MYIGKILSRRKRTRFTVNSIQTVPLCKRTGNWNRKTDVVWCAPMMLQAMLQRSCCIVLVALRRRRRRRRLLAAAIVTYNGKNVIQNMRAINQMSEQTNERTHERAKKHLTKETKEIFSFNVFSSVLALHLLRMYVCVSVCELNVSSDSSVCPLHTRAHTPYTPMASWVDFVFRVWSKAHVSRVSVCVCSNINAPSGNETHKKGNTVVSIQPSRVKARRSSFETCIFFFFCKLKAKRWFCSGAQLSFVIVWSTQDSTYGRMASHTNTRALTQCIFRLMEKKLWMWSRARAGSLAHALRKCLRIDDEQFTISDAIRTLRAYGKSSILWFIFKWITCLHTAQTHVIKWVFRREVFRSIRFPHNRLTHFFPNQSDGSNRIG